MINLPAYSGATIIAFVIADLVMLLLVFTAAGPVFIAGRDVYGRQIELVSRVRQVLMALVILGLCCYFAIQCVLLWRFVPYYVDGGAMTRERVTESTVVETGNGTPIAFWITTERHRFGVTSEIYRNIAKGDLIEARYRAADDTLYEIRIVARANDSGR